MKSNLKEVISYIQHGPVDRRLCWIYHYDRVVDEIKISSFEEFFDLQKEYGIPNHRIKAIILRNKGKSEILFKRADFQLNGEL